MIRLSKKMGFKKHMYFRIFSYIIFLKKCTGLQCFCKYKPKQGISYLCKNYHASSFIKALTDVNFRYVTKKQDSRIIL